MSFAHLSIRSVFCLSVFLTTLYMEDTNIVISVINIVCIILILCSSFLNLVLLFLDNLFLIFIQKYKHLHLVCALLSIRLC